MKRIGALVVSVVLGLSLVTVVPGCNSTTYTPPALTPQVSTPVIGQEGVLRVGVDANNSPFAGKPADTIIGLNVDMAAALADELGLKLQVVDIGANPDKALADGTVDIVVGVDSSDTTITCWQSEAYIQSGVALFAMSSASAVPALDSNPTIAAQSSSMSAWEVNKQYGETALQSSPELKTAFSDLQSGSVSFVAADAVIGTYAAYSNSPRINATMIALMEKPAGYTIGVLDSNSDLKQLISDTLVTLTSNGMINLIEVKWLGKAIDLSSLPFTPGVVTSENVVSTPDDTATTDTSGDTTDTTDNTGSVA